MAKNLVKKIQNSIFQHNLIERGDKIILAVSGGPDSVTMLDVFSELQKKYGLELAIAHTNYGLRGKDSDGDEKFVRKLSEEYGLRFFLYKPRVIPSKTSENELRKLRYHFFESVRKESNFDLIAVAHNLDDQVETFLMRLIRGSGLLGLSAMRYKNENIIRPLLSISRTEIERYLDQYDLRYRIDKTNLSSKFFRNKIRNRLLPSLEKNFNPKIKHTLSQALDSIKDDYSLLDEIAEKKFKTLGNLAVSQIMRFHPALQRRIILKAIKEKKLDMDDIESSHVEEIIKVIKSTKSKRQVVSFKGLKMTRQGDKITIENIKK